MIFVDNIFLKFFLKFQVVRVPKENPVLPVSTKSVLLEFLKQQSNIRR